MRTAASLEQSRRFAAEMAHWLELFDQELAELEIPVPKRPMRALQMLFEHDAIEVQVGEPVTADTLASFADTQWFRVLYAAVEHWYVEAFGPQAVLTRGNPPLDGAVLVRATPFALRIPSNRQKVHIPSEQSWMYFDDGLGEDEVAHDWIVDGPDLSRLGADARAAVEADAARVASALRFLAFRRVGTQADGNKAAQQLVVNLLSSLQQAARRLVGGLEAERGPAWYDLQIAAESALKAVLQVHEGRQPYDHSLDRLLRRASAYGVVFDAARLEDFPSPEEAAEWRYGQGDPWRLEFLYQAYLTTLDLATAALAQVPLGIQPGFGLLVRYAPWLSDTGKAEPDDERGATLTGGEG